MNVSKIFLVLLGATIFFSACKKEFSIEQGGINSAVGTWEFTDSLKTFSGNMDSVSIIKTGVNKELHLDGKSSDGTQNFRMVLYADSFKIGSYKASLFESAFDYSTSAKTIYQTSQLNGEFVVNITTINSTDIEGNFSGTALDSSGSLVNITKGKFKATFSNVISAPTSTGVLGDSVGNCQPVIISGNYKEGIAMTAGNTVQAQVTVAVPGTYTISTNSVNGIIFSTTGTFTSTGVQNVTLNASGTPAVSGDQVFTLHYGNSQCAFKISFLPAAAPSDDYFPLSLSTNWTYSLKDGTSSDSTFLKVINYSPTLDNNNYQTIARYSVMFPTIAIDSFYYRKPGGDYYEYINYTSLLGFDTKVAGEFIFLKDNVPAGTTWNSPTINGSVSGVPISGYAKMTLLEKAVPVTIGTYNFPDVIKVKYEYFLAGAAAPSYTIERWFAKNTGEIYNSSKSDLSTIVYQIADYQVF